MFCVWRFMVCGTGGFCGAEWLVEVACRISFVMLSICYEGISESRCSLRMFIISALVSRSFFGWGD